MSLNSLNVTPNRSPAGSGETAALTYAIAELNQERSDAAKTDPQSDTTPTEPPSLLAYIEGRLDPNLHDTKTRLNAIGTHLLTICAQSILPHPPTINGTEHINDYFEWQCKLKAKLTTFEHLAMPTKMYFVASRTTGAAFHIIQNDLPRPTADSMQETEQNVDVLFAKLDKWFYVPKERRLPADLNRRGQDSDFPWRE